MWNQVGTIPPVFHYLDHVPTAAMPMSLEMMGIGKSSHLYPFVNDVELKFPLDDRGNFVEFWKLMSGVIGLVNCELQVEACGRLKQPNWVFRLPQIGF